MPKVPFFGGVADIFLPTLECIYPTFTGAVSASAPIAYKKHAEAKSRARDRAWQEREVLDREVRYREEIRWEPQPLSISNEEFVPMLS